MADTELEVREKLERAFGRPLPDAIWKKLEAGGWVDEYLKNEMSWEEIFGQASDDLSLVSDVYREWAERASVDSGPPALRRRPRKTESLKAPQAWEIARNEANSVYAAESAENHPGVQRFRAEILGDHWPLTQEQAYRFVSSVALARLSPKWFENQGISLTEHTADVDSYEYDDDAPMSSAPTGVIGTTAAGEAFEVTRAFPAEPPRRVKLWVLSPPLTKGGLYKSERVTLPIAEDKEKYLYYPGSQYAQVTAVWPGSVLDPLRSLSEDLARDNHHWWEEPEAVWFVLRGVMPLISPLVTEVSFSPGAKTLGRPSEDRREAEDGRPSTAAIKLTVEPWVSAEQVKRAYRETQLELGIAKPSWEQNLKVYLFVKEKEKEGVDRSELPTLWNEQASEDWRYEKSHGFWQAYNNAKRTVEEVAYHELDW